MENHQNNPQEDIVVDTTGSIIYTGEIMLRRLRRNTVVLHLAMPPEIRAGMLNAYVTKQRPVLWQGIFRKKQNETSEEALSRYYPKLLYTREKLYERYADVTIDYYERIEEDFGISDVLNEAAIKKL